MMPELTEDLARQIQETHDTVIQLRTTMLGPNGADDGMCGDVKRAIKRIHDLELKFWILVAILVGAGIIGGSIFGT